MEVTGHGTRLGANMSQLYICSTNNNGDDPAHRLSLPFHGYLQNPQRVVRASAGQKLIALSHDGRCGTWIYVDGETHEVKYGEHAVAEKHTLNHWDMYDHTLLMDGWEGFMAVKEGPGLWALYFDVDGMSFMQCSKRFCGTDQLRDNGLRGKVTNKRILEVELNFAQA